MSDFSCVILKNIVYSLKIAFFGGIVIKVQLFSETLSALRRERKLSQKKAAQELGISQALLSHYENGAREPKLEFVIKACEYYGVSTDYILGRTEDRRFVTLPKTKQCDNASKYLDVTEKVFKALNGRKDKALYTAAVEYLSIPSEVVLDLLADPNTPYDAERDARMKMAESEFVKKLRR
jgi:transcriptional regulator with XRE-family HTH domain